MLDATLRPALAEADRLHLRRVRRTVERCAASAIERCAAGSSTDRAGHDAALGSAEVIVEGRRLVNFCGNDYLGLARHPAVASKLCEAAATWGTGSGASHLVTGHGIEHERLEQALAAFVGRERALLFSTGYMANLAVLTSLAGRGDRVLLDRLSHASLIDAAILSRASLRRYPHADAATAARLLSGARNAAPASATAAGMSDPPREPPRASTALIATDGVFSMDGDVAPIAALADAAERHGAWLIVDDAHGLGVLGATGRGTLEHLGIAADRVPVLVGTLGKAFGTFGAFVAGSRELIETLMQRARSYIYTTALPHAVAAATHAALEVAQRESWRRERVLALTQRFRSAARGRGLPLTSSSTPIQPIVLGSAEAALAMSRRLDEAGLWVAAIRPPTVPARTARLRITLSAAHTEEQVDALVEALVEALAHAVPGEPLDRSDEPAHA
ncbi:MAG: aminotransferase class I/II-fold pyridoxal phosphate-dependent enzyme [Steroidobacteraceae bacterium]